MPLKGSSPLAGDALGFWQTASCLEEGLGVRSSSPEKPGFERAGIFNPPSGGGGKGSVPRGLRSSSGSSSETPTYFDVDSHNKSQAFYHAIRSMHQNPDVFFFVDPRLISYYKNLFSSEVSIHAVEYLGKIRSVIQNVKKNPDVSKNHPYLDDTLLFATAVSIAYKYCNDETMKVSKFCEIFQQSPKSLQESEMRMLGDLRFETRIPEAHFQRMHLCMETYPHLATHQTTQDPKAGTVEKFSLKTSFLKNIAPGHPDSEFPPDYHEGSYFPKQKSPDFLKQKSSKYSLVDLAPKNSRHPVSYPPGVTGKRTRAHMAGDPRDGGDNALNAKRRRASAPARPEEIGDHPP